ncbi:MAG: tubulin-like doman-containing protein, partial [Blastocatellia bacterium]
VGVEPPTLTFAEQDGRLQRITAESRPWLLKITWFTLLLLLLPALLWTLAHLEISREEPVVKVEEKMLLPDVARPSLPTRLPALPIVDETREEPIPTLFIGLGGMGRRALAAARGDLKQAHLGREGQPYRFLWIDLDTKEEAREMPFDEWAGHPIEQLIAPSDVRQADRYLPDRWETPDHLSWFPSSDYGDAQQQQAIRERLNLSEGARGDRVLARLALFQWLARKDGLPPQLVERCQALEKFPSADGVRQIVVFGADDGGAGSGWFMDFGRLLSRIGRQQQQESPDFIPEVIGVLCGASNSMHPENRRALAVEIESAAMARAFPQRVTYQPGAPLLDQIDKESPYNCVFAVTSFDAASAAAQSGSLASILVERHPRSSLLKQALALPKGQIVSTATHAAHVLPTQVYELVRLDLFLRMLGPDILLDIVPNSQANLQGGYAPKPVTNDVAMKLLERWAQAETPGDPLQLLLAAAIDSTQTPGYINLARKTTSSLRDWFGDAFPVSLNRRLHGQGESDGMRWQREMMPSEAIAALRLLAGRLEQNVKPDLGSRGADTEAVDYVINLSLTAADELERWVRDFCRVCEQAARRLGDLDHLRHNLSRLRDRTYLDLEPDPEQVDQWAKQCLDSWLATPDNISAIRRRLFFEVSVEGSNSKVVVHSRIADPTVFNNAEETAKAADQLARSLAYLVPTARIGGALANLKDDQRRTIAQSLVNVRNTPRHVLVVTPKPSGTETQRAVMENFKQTIPHPASHGERGHQTGDDHSTIKRVELAEAPVVELSNRQASLPFVETGERSADVLRQRAESKHQIVIPIFPPQLRIALANPTAFQSFARAYRAGHIVRRPDAAGREQWTFLDTGDFLTAGSDHSLVSAAANYVWRLTSRPQDFTVIENGGDFSKLIQWKTNPGMPDDDTIALIAIDSSAD